MRKYIPDLILFTVCLTLTAFVVFTHHENETGMQFEPMVPIAPVQLERDTACALCGSMFPSEGWDGRGVREWRKAEHGPFQGVEKGPYSFRPVCPSCPGYPSSPQSR